MERDPLSAKNQTLTECIFHPWCRHHQLFFK